MHDRVEQSSAVLNEQAVNELELCWISKWCPTRGNNANMYVIEISI